MDGLDYLRQDCLSVSLSVCLSISLSFCLPVSLPLSLSLSLFYQNDSHFTILLYLVDHEITVVIYCCQQGNMHGKLKIFRGRDVLKCRTFCYKNPCLDQMALLVLPVEDPDSIARLHSKMASDQNIVVGQQTGLMRL